MRPVRPGLWRVATAATVAVLSVGLLAASVGVTDWLRSTPTPGKIRPASQVAAESGRTPDPWARPLPTAAPAPDTIPADLARGPVAAPGSGPLGLKWSWAQPATFPFVTASSGGWTFTEVEWCDVQPRPGVFDWTAVDRWVRETRTLGHEPMIKLRAGQCWGTADRALADRDPTENVTKETSTPPTDLPAYLAFVRATVQRYTARGVTDYAIENEPDVPNSWAGGLGEYRALVHAVARAIRHVAPQAQVVDGGVSSSAYGVVLAAAELEQDPDGAVALYRSYYDRRVSAGVSRFPPVETVADLESVLASTPGRRAVRGAAIALRLANSGTVDAYQLHYYESPATLPALLRYLEDGLDPGVPVEAWEVGVAWPGEAWDATVQARDVYRQAGELLAAGVRPVLYLPVAYSAAPGKVQVFRGLTEPTGRLLPAGGGWLRLSRALAGLRDRPLWPARGGLGGVAWRIGSRQAALVWATDAPVPLRAADVARMTDASGAILRGTPVVGPDPVLVLGSAGGSLTQAVAGRG